MTLPSCLNDLCLLIFIVDCNVRFKYWIREHCCVRMCSNCNSYLIRNGMDGRVAGQNVARQKKNTSWKRIKLLVLVCANNALYLSYHRSPWVDTLWGKINFGYLIKNTEKEQIFYCCKQSLTRLCPPSILPSTHPTIHPVP